MSDAFAPSGLREHLLARAALYRAVREFFATRQVLEVELPQLATSFVTDPFIEPIVANNGGQTLYLQSSPEYAMKRLLATYGECIYALGKVFRAGERGRRHNPEFTLLEWYRIGFDDRELMAEVAALITSLMPHVQVHYFSYRQWFMQRFDLDPHLADIAQLRQAATGLIDIDSRGLDANAWLDLLVTHVLEPQLPTGLTFVYDYPASQAALARIVPDDTGQPVARRFEAFLGGMELANGYWELTDAAEQRRRFEADLAARRARNLPEYPVDEKLLAALDSGLPDCAGVALGLDRLLMQITGADTIAQVLSFDITRV